MKKLFVPLLLCCFSALSFRAEGKTETFNEYTFTGPYTYRNLSVYLIHGKDRVAGNKFLILQEAMKNRAAVVYETASVNELKVSNRSNDHDIFIMAGDIVKGGKQDRVIQFSYLVPPRTEKMPIACFCVEQGRWQQRGGENVAAFHSSENMIASKELKMSVKKEGSQSGVWAKVSEMQGKLGDTLGGSVRSNESDTSLQLTLENKKLEETEKDYRAHLLNIIKDRKDALGYAFVINGSINSAEVFAAGSLFRKLWPKLIRSSIVEAISAGRNTGSAKVPTAGEIKRFLVESENARQTSAKRVSADTAVIEGVEGQSPL